MGLYIEKPEPEPENFDSDSEDEEDWRAAAEDWRIFGEQLRRQERQKQAAPWSGSSVRGRIPLPWWLECSPFGKDENAKDETDKDDNVKDETTRMRTLLHEDEDEDEDEQQGDISAHPAGHIQEGEEQDASAESAEAPKRAS